MRWNTSTRSTKKKSTRRSTSNSMEVVRWEDCILVMEAVMGEARIMDMDIITTMDIIPDMVRDREVGAVGLTPMVAIKRT